MRLCSDAATFIGAVFHMSLSAKTALNARRLMVDVLREQYR